MGDADTATIELTKGEAREVINALSAYRTEVTGDEQDRALQIREFLQREFDFEDRHFEDDEGVVDALADAFGDEEDHEVTLSRAEAAEVVAALTALEPDAGATETETLAAVRDRVEERFGVDDTR